jgi:NhaP-type Na+/H+ or K+/H+ antiporter
MRNPPWVSRFLGGPDFEKCRSGISRELFRGGLELTRRVIFRFERGATQLGFVDVLTTVILLGILLWVATLQFAVYKVPPTKPTSTSSAASSH